jgi:hypothetical protein
VENGKFLPPPGLELRPLGRPARSQSLYRLPYSSSYPLGTPRFLYVAESKGASEALGNVPIVASKVVSALKRLSEKYFYYLLDLR